MITKLLDWSKENLWKNQKNLGELGKEQCRKFYYDKTFGRVEVLLEQIRKVDGNDVINGTIVPSVKSMMLDLDESLLSEGDFCNFHGDFILDNIIITSNGFRLIDWRQDFSGNVDVGDMYYDLAKLNGGIYVSYQNIKQNLFIYQKNTDDIILSIQTNKFLKESKKIFNNFIKIKNFDVRKIEILTGIIFLNMAAMHHEPFDHFIYNLGKIQINKWINLKK